MSNDHSDPYYFGSSTRRNRDIDTYRASENLKMVGMLFAAGAHWTPNRIEEVTRVRQSLMKMAPKYTYDFIQMVHHHQAAGRRDLKELVRTQPMVQLLKKRSRKIPELIAGLPEDLSLAASTK